MNETFCGASSRSRAHHCPPPPASLLVVQAGFLVGLPYQVFGSPSPQLQLSRFRWLVTLLMLNTYANVLLMPGTLGFGLAFAFEQVRVTAVCSAPLESPRVESCPPKRRKYSPIHSSGITGKHPHVLHKPTSAQRMTCEIVYLVVDFWGCQLPSRRYLL